MTLATIQIPSIVLPQVWVLGTETETVGDLVTHASIDIPVEYLQEKVIHIIATEVITGAALGNLWAWIELSPVPTTTSALYWAAIGGGGGTLAPFSPNIIVASVVNLTVHSFFLPWTIHSPYARLVVQTPANAGLPGNVWAVQALISGKAV